MKIIRTIFLSYLIYCLALSPTLAVDTASLLPNAVQQFFDNNGNPLTSGKVTTYAAGTSTLKTTWKDSTELLPNTNPIVLDAGGKAIIYGSGTYRQVVKDRNGNLIWDAVTAPGGGGSSPSSVGDGNLVGTILPWSGLVAPNQYVFAYGQELSRTTYSDYYTAVTQQLNVICTSASNILTGIADTSQVKIGSAVELALCVSAGTTVTAKTPATITLSNPSSVSINSVATFFPWGNGDGSTTFNVPDLRGIVPIGRDNMGGTSANRITTTSCGNGITPDALGAFCNGNVGGAHTISTSELPPLTYVKSDINATAGVQSGTSFTVVQSPFLQTTTPVNPITISGSSFSVIPPSLTINYIAKVTPDTSTSIATGVYSIGGMTGVISCSTGITCTGNYISATGNLPGGPITAIQYNYDGTNFRGSANLEFISPDTLTLGAAGVTGKFDIYGSTSGKVRQIVQAVALTPTVTWGNGSGTPVVTSTSPLIISTSTGNLTISPDGLTRINDTNVTLTLGGSPLTSLLAPISITAGWSGTLSGTRGGTGVNNGASTITVAGNFAVTTNGGTLSYGAASKTLTVNKSITLEGTDGTTMTFPSVSATIPRLVASGAKTLNTTAISSATCSAEQTDTATGTLTTDRISVNFNGDPTAITGYVPLTTGMLTIMIYPKVDAIGFKVCNNTNGFITPGAVTLNWGVVR